MSAELSEADVPEVNEYEEGALEEALAATEGAVEDADEEDDEGVQEHLKDAVEGTLRIKRLLSTDADAGATKKRKIKADEGPDLEVQEKAKKLLMKWGLATDLVSKHVLEDLTVEDLDFLETSNYVPDKYNQRKKPGELIAQTIAMVRERKSSGGAKVDPVTAFKFRHNLPADVEPKLRELSHKDLRYVLRQYDGSESIDDVIAQAAASSPDDGAAGTLPEGPGAEIVGRFNRLELIDPLADAAVFGDANLSFALKLAQHRKALGHVGRVIATTFEDIETLRERYKEIDETIKILEEHFAEVYHGVDCTRIAVDPRFQGMEESLGAVYYNFPHAGAVSGFFDGHPLVNWRHENLMRNFFRALRSFVKPQGWVKVSSNMGAVGVRYSYIVGSAIENEFIHVETVPFLEWHLQRYGRSYGDRRDSYKRPGQAEGYNAQRAEGDMVYTFQYAPSGNPVGKQTIRMPPKFATLMACTDGPFLALQGEARKRLATQLFQRFVTESSGKHVG